MKLYYIEDTMFETSLLASQINERFTTRLLKEAGSLVLISSTHTRDQHIQRWTSELPDEICVLSSPSLFEHGDVKGNLHHTFLALDGFPMLEVFHGTCIEIDTVTKRVEQIYLNLFPKHDHVDNLDLLMDQLEDVLCEKIKTFKKNKTEH